MGMKNIRVLRITNKKVIKNGNLVDVDQAEKSSMMFTSMNSMKENNAVWPQFIS